MTAVHGLEAFGASYVPLILNPYLTLALPSDVDLKKAAKLFAQKFATGSSVTKNQQGQDEIIVQGDVSEEILDMISDQVGVLKGVPEDNVELVEEKKKKGGE